MKWLMFSPVVRRSAIGRMSVLVTEALIAGGHEVKIVRTEIDPTGDDHDFGVPVISWTDSKEVEAAARDSDFNLYQVGDNFPFHAGAIHWLPKLPGALCLHDFFVGSLFREWCEYHGVEPDDIVEEWYGKDVVGPYRAVLKLVNYVDRTAATVPMTEWLCSQATSVVTHSSWGIDRVLRSCAGPVRTTALPYRSAVSATRVRAPGLETLRLLTVGHVNQNKRIDTVIRSIGSSAHLRDCITYSVLGQVQPDVQLELIRLARAQGVRLAIPGVVDDQALANALAEADVVVALRWPCLEAASASVIESLLAGKPTIVTRAAFYDELPDDCVWKVEPGAEAEGVRDALEHLLSDPAARLQLGRRAQAFALATYTADHYVETLEALATDLYAMAPLMQTVDELLETMRRWGPSVPTAETFAVTPLADLWAGNRGS